MRLATNETKFFFRYRFFLLQVPLLCSFYVETSQKHQNTVIIFSKFHSINNMYGSKTGAMLKMTMFLSSILLFTAADKSYVSVSLKKNSFIWLQYISYFLHLNCLMMYFYFIFIDNRCYSLGWNLYSLWNL